ncbi:hypothetical protein JMJ35_003724 [Cladonia borealis]|uniref:Required for respiratory growth protein 9, mitochondrial n=1 Tax=Cladonia borealis TaxID=184061 RepID=A0AA39V334_9LECA|nr:hypothetical protein JMJ35_003724 [Cladonia borealis]
MPCSACTTNVLQRFLGGFEIFAFKTAGLPPTRQFYSTGARHFYNARSTPRRTTRNPRFVEPSEHLDLKILRQTSTPPIEPALGKEDEQEKTDGIIERVEAADAVGGHIRVMKSEQPQSHRKDSNSLDKGWWEENYSSDLRKSNRPHSASSPPSVSQSESQSPSTIPSTKSPSPDPPDPPKPRTGPSPWQIQKAALTTKFPTGWIPRKRLSPSTLDGIRTLHAQYPLKYTTPVLASQFKVSPEAIRRILKSKWRPSDEEEEERVKRWENRGKSIWEGMAEVGLKPPRKWREMGVRKRVGGRGKARRWGENRRERRRREREGEGGKGEAMSKGKSKNVSTAFTIKGIPAIEAVRPGLGYQVPLADRIL